MKFEFLGKLRDGEDVGSSGEIPVDEVTQLSEQGYSETEIIEQLRDHGYSYGDINEALNAAVKENASRRGGGGMDPGGGQGGGDWEPRQTESFGGAQQQQQPQQQAPPPPPEPEPAYDEGYDDDWGGDSLTISPEEEELIEIIVSEHMGDIEGEMEQLRTEIDQVRSEFENLRQAFNEIDIRKDEDEQVVIQKVNEMEEYFEQTHSRMGGMEKALQQVLPALVENVRELSSIVREMKEPGASSSSTMSDTSEEF